MKTGLVWRWLGLTIAAVVILSAVFYILSPHLFSMNWVTEFVFVCALYSVSFLVFVKSLRVKPQSRALVFMALTTGKMLLAMIFALVLIMGFEIDSLSDILYFVLTYLVFLVVEVMAFTKAISGFQNEEPEKMS